MLRLVLRVTWREGADRTMILGARLGALVREEHGGLLRREMEQQGVRFVQLVEQVAGVRVVRDAGSGLDVLIGLEGSLPPPPAEGPLALRSDVYEAFTRFGAPHWYEPETDEFRRGAPGEGAVACPEVRQSDLAEMRAGFADQADEPIRSDLLATLDGQEGSLGRFRGVVARTGLTTDWERFRYEALSEKVRDWAKSHGLEIQGAWFRRSESAQRRSGPRRLLHELVGAMTDAEARSILIPVSAIERYLSRRQQGPSG